MSKSATEIFSGKVNLICEYDKSSPLFVRQANTEIDNNNVERAIEILTGGIKLYPEYPTAFIMLGKSYALIGDYSKALHHIKTGTELIHSKKSYNHYLKEVENIKKQRSLFSESKGNVFITDNDIFEERTHPDLFQEESKTVASLKSDFVPDRIEKNEKHFPSKSDEVNVESKSYSPVLSGIDEGSTIVSETLAKIYAAQGEYEEAISVYEKLILKSPAKKEFYIKIINELKAKLNS